MTKNRFRVKHENFSEDAFNDCVRYCKAKILEKFIDGALIEIPPVGNPLMRKEGMNLYIHRWESFGFKVTNM